MKYIFVDEDYRSYVNNKLYVMDNKDDKAAARRIIFFIQKFMEKEKSIDMNTLSEEEKLIVDTAADKVKEELDKI